MINEISKYGIIPVVVLDNAEDAIPLAKALVEGGLPVAEVTFRTKAAKEAISLISKAYPDMLLGAGTVLSVEQVKDAVSAGAKFIVAPGFDPEVVDYCIANNIPVFPGCVTPSEVTEAYKRGLTVVKFFPAEDFGGIKTIKAISAPFPMMKFIPTGGVNTENIRNYLESDKILACGGTWMVKKDLIKNKEFDKIKDITIEACKVVKEVRG